MADLLVCEEKGLLMKVNLVDCLYVALGCIDDGVRLTTLVFEQQTCFWSIELCRIAYMMNHEKIGNGLLVFIWKVEETFVCDGDDARKGLYSRSVVPPSHLGAL